MTGQQVEQAHENKQPPTRTVEGSYTIGPILYMLDGPNRLSISAQSPYDVDQRQYNQYHPGCDWHFNVVGHIRL